MTTNTQHTALMEIGRNAYAAIKEMVDAVQLDWDRLEDLRSIRDNWDNDSGIWANIHPEEAAELAQLEAAAGDCKDYDDAVQRIWDDPLEISVRSGWAMVGVALEPEEYKILLTTGGPAVRIVGDLNGSEAANARLEVQDWGTPWVEYHEADPDTLLAYAQTFTFGD